MIQIGQDALGAWAWMLFNAGGGLVQSGHSFRDLELALAAAIEAWAEARIRGEPGIPSSPRIRFPDGPPA